MSADIFAAAPPDDDAQALANGFGRRLEQLARTLGAASADAVLAGQVAARLSMALADGHVCVPLDAIAQRLGVAAARLRPAILASQVGCDGSGAGAALLPLVLDPQQRCYLARSYDDERRLAYAIAAMTGELRTAAATAAPSRLSEPAAAGDTDPVEVDWQRVAALLARAARLTIISGGPGTGKTSTVAALLASLLEAEPGLRIALAAPTGKAAQRMQEALAGVRREPAASVAKRGPRMDAVNAVHDTAGARLPTQAFTLHRLLGGMSNGRFRHHRGAPLPYDVVVVDEASMIDLAMAARLFDALGPRARLVLLGDKDQLAAVEAGAVFGELSASMTFSAARRAALADALGIDAAWLPAASAECEPLADGVVWLSRNYRFGADSAIGRLAGAVRDGDAARAAAVLRPSAPAPAEVELAVSIEDDGAALSAATLTTLAAGFDDYVARLVEVLNGASGLAAGAGSSAAPSAVSSATTASHMDIHADSPTDSPTEVLRRLFDAFNAYRVLCVMRGGARGVDALNLAIAQRVRRAVAAGGLASASWYAGRPVMIARNDYGLGLFNGDIGIALPGPGGALRVVFPAAAGGFRALSAAALPPHDTAFAMTVHKSQGSEFEGAALVLPAEFSRGLTRELVYTALTRARHAVQVVGSMALFAQAVATRTERDSGLRDRLREALANYPVNRPLD